MFHVKHRPAPRTTEGRTLPGAALRFTLPDR